jgi:hypothetical protein
MKRLASKVKTRFGKTESHVVRSCEGLFVR